MDETKTRAGKDFYDNFYIKINQMNKKYNKTISIIELPTFARNTQIQIFVEDRLINQFLVNPSEEFLENQVNFTINILDELFANDQNFKKEFSY
nr:curli production assembly/transport protein CsgE [Cloacibacterium caeni]